MGLREAFGFSTRGSLPFDDQRGHLNVIKTYIYIIIYTVSGLGHGNHVTFSFLIISWRLMLTKTFYFLHKMSKSTRNAYVVSVRSQKKHVTHGTEIIKAL
jgi:hypothetical protein